MGQNEHPDDFASRREHLKEMSDGELHDYFWQLVEQIIEPLIAEARTHTTSSIERSILLRMGFTSMDAKALVKNIEKRGMLGKGAGRQVLELARAKRVTVAEAGSALLKGQWWQELPL